VIVVEVGAEEALPPPATLVEQVARQLWVAERASLRRRLAGAGLVLLRWDGETPLRLVLSRLRPAAPRSLAAGGPEVTAAPPPGAAARDGSGAR
jgi:hypothetical protein